MKNGPGSLNRIFRLVWNESTGGYVAVAENTSARGKRASRSVAAAVGSVVLAGSAFAAGPAAPPVNALPTGGQVAAGQARIDVGGNRMDITQSSSNAVLNWNSFNIGASAQVNFNQPNANAMTLNRVLGSDPSAIFGRLTANGQVLLVNPNGVVFGAGSKVDVGGIVAGSLQITDADFLANRLRFTRDAGSTGSVLNQGTIRAADGGYVALLAPEVINEGVLQANLGTVAMASGDAVTFDLSGNRLLSVKVDPSSIAALVENRQLIQADGGQVLLSAGAAQRLTEQAIASGAAGSGATTLVNDNGVMRLVAVGGQVSAGTVKAEGRMVDVSGSVTAGAAAGGQIGISADFVSQSGSLRADGASGLGGTVSVSGTQVVQTASAVLSADGVTGGGTVSVQGTHSGALGDDAGRVYSSATLSARGTGSGAVGGHVDVSADSVQLRAATLDADGRAGGGQIRVGGGYQGHDSDITNALDVGVNASTVLRADAVDAGNGGRVVVWSDQTTAFAGQIAARGGAAGGNGGSAEVSGKAGLAFAGAADLSAAKGTRGNLLLDPRDIVIDDAGATIASLSLDAPDGDTHALFGSATSALTNGNVVITAPEASTAGVSKTGAVYLFSSRTGALLAQLRGSHANDKVGNGGITVLANQNYIVKSNDWDPTVGGATYYSGSNGYYQLNSNVDGASGALTWQSGTGNGGASAVVGSANSLVGNKLTNDRVASATQTLLSNGNLVFSNPGWNNGRGAVTWMNAATGQLGDGSAGGTISATNSLVGSTAIRATALQEGGVWITGINSARSTVHSYSGGARNGTSDTPNVMGAGDEVGRGGVIALADGAYAVASPTWSNGSSPSQAYVGAATYGAATGTVGAVSLSNSLHGVNAYDFAGSLGLVAVGAADANGFRDDYLVLSPFWGSGGTFLQTTSKGAVTWVDGDTGIAKGDSAVGANITTGNSLVGNSGDRLGSSAAGSTTFYTRTAETWYSSGSGYYSAQDNTPSAARGTAYSSGITVLKNGNYLVASTTTGGGKGSVTWGNGGSGIAGSLSSSNSLIGSGTGDAIGSGGILQLSGGRYAVLSSGWDGSGTDLGAVTWGSATGVTGVVSASNSLVGSATQDRIGSGGLVGVGAKDADNLYANLIVLSPQWGSGSTVSTTAKGAVSFIDGGTGQLVGGAAGGAVSASNSLVGGSGGDYVGSFHGSDTRSGSYNSGNGTSSSIGGWNANLTATVDVLANGSYLVRSASWSSGKGAATWGSGTTGVAGTVSASNSLVGTVADVYAPVNGTFTPANDVSNRTFDTVTRTMTQTGDHVGLQSLVLTNGNVAVSSPFWSDGRGAVTLISGVTGKPAGSATAGAAVSASNSLVGSTPDTYTTNGSGGRTGVLTVGDHVGAVLNDPDNYVVPVVSNLHNNASVVATTQLLLAPYQLGYSYDVSYSWNDPSYNPGSSYHYRSVTIGSNSTFSGLPGRGLDELASGNLLVRSASWNNGSTSGAGAITWMDGGTGALSTGTIGGTVSSSNSLVGSHTDDRIGATALTALDNGNGVLANSAWNSNRGAVTWINGSNGLLSSGATGGEVSAANSLVGSTGDSIVALNGYHLVNGVYVNGPYQGPDNMGDRIGSTLVALPGGNVVIGSSGWAKVGNSYSAKGAATWMNGATGALIDGSAGGVLSAANSLVGSQGGDNVSSGGITALTGGRYVVVSSNWANGNLSAAGAVTWGGATGVAGAVSASNSLVGTHANDYVGNQGITLLSDGVFTNYLVGSYQWNGSAGAATWVDGNTGRAYGDSSSGAAVSASNSLVGTTRSGGYIGLSVTQLQIGSVKTGDAVINSDYWSDCGLIGSVTLMPGATGLAGEVSWRNSQLGMKGTAQANGGYSSVQFTVLPYAATADEKVKNRVVAWTASGNSHASVLSVVDETAATPTGRVGHSTLSQTAGDSADWTTAGFAADASGFSSLGGSNGLFAFSALTGNNLVITPGLITSMLNAGTAVTLQASNDITVAKAVVANNANGNGGDFTLQAGRAIHINANVVTDNGSFSAIANSSTVDGVVSADCGTCTAEITMKDGVQIDAGTGNVTLNLKTGSNTGDVVLGSLHGHTVQVSNAIGSIRSNTAANAVMAGDTLAFSASRQVVLGSSGQTLAVIGGDTTIEASGYDGSGSVQLGTGASFSGDTLTLRARTTAALAQFGDSSARSGLNTANGDFWLTGTNLSRLLAQSTGVDAITLGRSTQTGATYYRGMDLSATTGASVTVRGGSGGLMLNGSTLLGSGSTLTLASAGAIATDGSFYVTNPTLDAATLALQGGGSVTLNSGSLTLNSGTLSIETSANTSVTPNSGFTITADSLRLKGAAAAFDFSGNVNDRVNKLAADVRSLKLVNAGALAVATVGDVQGVTLQQGGTIEARGSNNDLTLNNAVHSASGNLVLAAGRHFVNNTAFGTGLDAGSGRYLVYSRNPADSLEGVAVEHKHYNQAYAAGTTPGYASSGNWFLYSVAPTLTVGAGTVSAVYGSSDASSATVSYGGFIDGDTVQTAGITGNAPTLNIAGYTATGAGYRPVGSYATSFSGNVGGLASSLGYGFTAGAASGTYTVTQRDLHYTGSTVYDGGTTVAASLLSSADRFNGDAVQIGGSGTRGRDAGNQAVTLGSLAISGADAANYRLADATVTVTPRTVTVTASDAAKVYGAADPTLAFSVGGLGLAGGDSAATVFSGALSTTTGAAATAGTHAITQGSLATNGNYQVGSFQPGTLTVSKAALTVSADDKSKVYGDATPTLGYSVLASQLKYNDAASVVSGVALATDEGAAATAGSHAIHASGGTAANYTLSYVDGTLSVAKAALAVTADDKAKVYGDATPALSYSVQASQLKYGDAASVVSGIVLGTAEGGAATAGSHAITVSGGTAANYAIVAVDGTLSVAKAALTVTADDKSKVYGNATPALTYSVDTAQLKYGDSAAVVRGVNLATAEGAAATAGTHAIHASAGTADNYAISTADGTLTVSKATLGVRADDKTKAFGAPTPALSYTVDPTQLKYGDAASVVSGISLATDEGTAATAGSHAITASGGSAANYTVVTSDGVLTVLPERLKAENLVVLAPVPTAPPTVVPVSLPIVNIPAPHETLQPGQLAVVNGGLQVKAVPAPVAAPTAPATVATPLVLATPLPAQAAQAGQAWHFDVPASTFRSEGGSPVTMEARQADGRPLPSWLSFDAKTGTLSGTPPSGFSGTLSLQIVARDGEGNQASSPVELKVAAR